MIKIINGTYGFRNPRTGIIEAKTAKSEPFSLVAEREAELVSAGVAEYVGDEPAETDFADTEDAEYSYSDKNTVAELRTIADKLGVTVPDRATKKQIIAALDDALSAALDAEGEEEYEDGEDAPDISAILPE